MEVAHRQKDWNQRETLYRNTNIHAIRVPIVTRKLVHFCIQRLVPESKAEQRLALG